MTKQELVHPLALLEPLLSDPQVVEIMVDGPHKVYVDKQGRLEDVPSPFRDQDHLMEVIEAILTPMGRRVDESHPMVDVRLPDGSRVNVVIPPISLSSPVLTLRKFPPQSFEVADLLRFGSWDEHIVTFVQACVQGRLNILVSGGTGSGKTSLLNVIANQIPDDERIIAIQNAAELRLSQKRVVTLETRPPNLEGRGEVSAEDLVRNALKMRPDRIILSEIMEGAEALMLLDAATRGHDGSLMSMHATSPRDALFRLEMMITTANPSVPLLNVRRQLVEAIDIIVHLERLRDGSRKVLKVSEVESIKGDVIILQDIFEFRQTGFQEGRIQGHFGATGQIPQAIKRLRLAGQELPLDLFTPR